MKSFFKTVLAVIVGMVLSSIVIGVVFMGLIGSLLAIEPEVPAVKPGTVLHLRLVGQIEERTQDNPLGLLLGSTAADVQGLDDILEAIHEAERNDDIRGIYIEGGLLSADMASLEEIRKAITDFRKTGKFVMAYAENYSQGAYYVASAADSVFIEPTGMLDWHGIASQPIFYTQLLEKVGVKMQVFRVGTYKSYVEPYTRTDMSEANREQIASFIGDIWKVVCRDVAASRHVSIDSLNALADRYMPFANTDDYVKAGLVDRTTRLDEMREVLADMMNDEKPTLMSPADIAAGAREKADDGDGEIAIYYAYGDIVGSEAGVANGEGYIVGTKVVEDLDALMNDDEVKAVVIRINSGGGSAFASEQMWQAVRRLCEKKPVVVSMGGMAASGGYYMACAADYIVADPTTLTGSIGIFGMIPDMTGLLTDKLGLHFDVVKTNEASDFGALGRPLNARESQTMQAYVDRGYRLFLERVAEGRQMPTDSVAAIAEGRVWTGRQALQRKLVDRLGTLQDAVNEAARRADLGTYATVAYPEPVDWFERLLEGEKSDYMERRLQSTLGEWYRPLRFAATLEGRDCLQARMPFEPNMNH